jgi:hypothetical protein
LILRRECGGCLSLARPGLSGTLVCRATSRYPLTRIGPSAEAFTAQTTRIVDVLSAGIDRAALTEFDITTCPPGRTAYSTEAPLSARGPVDGIAHARPAVGVTAWI